MVSPFHLNRVTLGQAALSSPSLKPVHLLLAVAELGHLDGLAYGVFGAQDHPLGDVAGQVRVLAQLAGDDLPGHFQELFPSVRLEVEGHEPGRELRAVGSPVNG